MKQIFLAVFYFMSLSCQHAYTADRIVEGTSFPGVEYKKNYVINPEAEKNKNNVTDAGTIVTRTTTTPLQGVGSFAIDATTSGQKVKFDTTLLDPGLKGQNCESKFVFSGDATLYKAYIEENATPVTADLQLTNEANARTVSIKFACGTAGLNVHLVIEATSNSAAAIKVDKVYLGEIVNGTDGALLLNSASLNPTYTKLTTGTAQTYTTPVGVKYIVVKMIGGGGGGSGSGTAAGSGAGNGGDTTFDNLTAGGGVAGVWNAGGSGGGAVTVGAGWTDIESKAGGGSQGFMQVSTGVNLSPGGIGGVGCFDNAAPANSYSQAGNGGNPNSGNGGQGGGGNATSGADAGTGGGSGGCVIAMATAPAASYVYTIGPAGTAGGAGTSGLAGGAGGTGYILVTEYYNTDNVPLIVGSVTSNTTGTERIERAYISDTCAINSQSGTWIASTTNPSTGNCTLTFASGIFSANPSCTCSAEDTAGSTFGCVTNASSGTDVKTGASNTTTGAGAARAVNVICMGPR